MLLRFVSALLGGLLTLVVFACAPAPRAVPAQVTPPATQAVAGAASASLTPVAAATGSPQRGGTLVVAVTADPGQFNSGISTAGGTHAVADNLYNGLVFLDEQLNPQPDLAESWTVSPDGKTYTFALRQGVKWHDGQPFSSADVKFTFEEILLKYHARTKAGLEGVLEGIDTPDPNTVVMRFKQPYGPLLQRLDMVEAPILPRHVYEGQDPTKAEANLKPVGTGPFKLADYVKGDRVRMVRNDQYYKPGLPYLDELVFRIIPQPSTAALALEQNEVDFLGSVPGPDLSRMRQNPDLAFGQNAAGSGGSFCQETMIYNLSRAPLDKVQVRQALAYAIDRDEILKNVYFGQGKVANAAISSGLTWAYNPNAPKYPLDRARANTMLDQAGLPRGPDGTRFKLQFVHATSYAKTGESLRQQLAQVGVDFQLTPMEVNAANEREFIQKDFDVGFASYCNGPDPEIGVRRMYVSSNIGPILFSNGAGYRNPEVDDLFDRAAAAVDRQQRSQLYGQIQDIVGRDLPYWWLVETENVRAWRKSFHNLFIWSGELAEAAWVDPK
jgi:peptide/nickel transport system substrate-binding protein